MTGCVHIYVMLYTNPRSLSIKFHWWKMQWHYVHTFKSSKLCFSRQLHIAWNRFNLCVWMEF